MSKLMKKERNAMAEIGIISCPFKSHKDEVDYLRQIGIKTWKKDRHYKKESLHFTNN